jgi:hypothetical protein
MVGSMAVQSAQQLAVRTAKEMVFLTVVPMVGP